MASVLSSNEQNNNSQRPEVSKQRQHNAHTTSAKRQVAFEKWK